MTAYDKIDALNWSTLKIMDEASPAYAKHQYDHPEERKDKAAYVSGRAIHCATLEPDQFDNRYVVMPTFSGTGSKAAKREWLDDLPDGVEAIKQADYDMAWRAAGAVRANSDAMALLDEAECEKIVTWELGRIKCKGRLDALTDRVVDLKMTRRNTLYEVEKDAAIFNYHAQLAWYHDGVVKAELISGEKLPAAIFVHADQKSTFTDLAILDMDEVDGTFFYGRAKYQTLLKRYIGCKAANWWPGMAPKPVMWVLPEWKLRADEEEVKI
jgi:hypothetical protein